MSILRTTRNLKWMGKDWSPFWPLSLHHRLIVCWLLLSRHTPNPAIHAATKKKIYLLFICLPLLYFLHFFRLFALGRPESTKAVTSFLHPISCIYIYMTFIEDNALDRWGGANIFFFILLKKNLQNGKKKNFHTLYKNTIRLYELREPY